MNPDPTQTPALSKTWITINYVNLILLVLLYTLKELHQWTLLIFPLIFLLLSVFIWSYIKAYWLSGAWNVMHIARPEQEEDRAIKGRVYRHAYSYFSVITICILLTISIMDISLNIVMVAGLLYFAHALPCSIYQWRLSGRNSE